MKGSDLAVETFKVLRNVFLDTRGNPLSFPLRDKRNTQDDPLDEYICELFKNKLPNETTCIKSPGPLITPDLVVLRPAHCRKSSKENLRNNLSCIIAIEVKKLERTRTKSRAIARPTGLDYNTTPPCGTVRIYDAKNQPIDIHCFYLFVCQERDPERPGHYKLTAITLCDGDVLNQDFEYYLSITGERTKRIGLGTYGDGFDRQRPMLVFANPLGQREMDRRVTLIHSKNNLHELYGDLSHTNILQRTILGNGYNEFYCYRYKKDVPKGWEISVLRDPFPTPEREERTQKRGRFRLDFTLTG